MQNGVVGNAQDGYKYVKTQSLAWPKGTTLRGGLQAASDALQVKIPPSPTLSTMGLAPNCFLLQEEKMSAPGKVRTWNRSAPFPAIMESPVSSDVLCSVSSLPSLLQAAMDSIDLGSLDTQTSTGMPTLDDWGGDWGIDEKQGIQDALGGKEVTDRDYKDDVLRGVLDKHTGFPDLPDCPTEVRALARQAQGQPPGERGHVGWPGLAFPIPTLVQAALHSRPCVQAMHSI